MDHQLWTTNVPAPSAQLVTGTKPDGSPSYMSYDPTGATTRGLPQPRYGELKNFGYVPKPGEVRVGPAALHTTAVVELASFWNPVLSRAPSVQPAQGQQRWPHRACSH